MRADIKADRVTNQGGRERAKCDLCGRRRGVQMHELVDRKYTVKNEAARELSFQAELVVLICPECHDLCHRTNPARYRAFLFGVNYERYGYQQVKTAFDALKAVMPSLPFELPENDTWIKPY